MFEIRLTRTPGCIGDGIDVRILDRERREYAEPVNMRLRKHDDCPDGAIIPPAVHLSMDEGQSVMDQLWSCGLRPTEGTGSAGALAAVENHLGDMRRIVFRGFSEEERDDPSPSYSGLGKAYGLSGKEVWK